MHHRSSWLGLGTAILFSALGVACSSADGAISIEPATGALSENGGDQLFTIKLDEARDEGYELAQLTVKVKPDGAEEVTIACAPVDTNNNQQLDQGEKLTCSEGTTNVFGPSLAGKEATVALRAKIDGNDELVGEATWTPK